MSRGRQPQSSQPAAMPPWARWIALLSVAALVVSTLAIALTLLRGTGSNGDSCGTVAWNALPDASALPEGWTVAAGNFYADGSGTSFTGPTPADGSSPPTMYLQVTCFGSSGHLAMTRSHQSATAAGATDATFIDLGDESFATEDPSNGSTSVYVRRGILVAILVAPTSLDPAVIEVAAGAVDDALASAGSGKAPPSAAPRTPRPISSGSSIPSIEPSASDSGSPSPTPAHAAVDLEALLPLAVGGVPLTRQSTLGTSGLLGTDPSSQALIDSLTGLGKTPADLEIAAAYDDSQTIQIFAFRLKGIKGPKLGQAIVDSYLAAGPSGVTSVVVTISGKQVTHVAYGDGGTDDYVYVHGDIVFDVASGDPATAAQSLAALP